LTSFLLPGGSHSGAALHLARTVARRAERLAVTVAGREQLNPVVVTYLNRLSDFLFVVARFVNRVLDQPEPAGPAPKALQANAPKETQD
ncbi:MAG TPA: ATP:cob(I)alamin adenosyltransferase, partial [Stenomitos sp.]